MVHALGILASGELSGLGILLNVALLPLLAVLSGWFSGSEAVLFSLTRTQLQHNAASSNPLRRLAAALMEQPKRTLTIILLGNSSANVLLFASTYVLGHQLRPMLGGGAAILSAVVSVLLVCIVGEAIPKTLGVNLADRLAPYAAPLVRFFGYVLGPAGRVLNAVLVEPLSRLLLGHTPVRGAEQHDLSTFELRTLLEMSRRRGVINPTEDAFLREVIDLGYLKVRDVMVPRVEVKAYDVNGPADGLRALMRATRRKKIPVFEGSVDNIVGLIYAKRLFLEPQLALRQLVMPVRFVPELINCEQLLHHFRQTRTQLAIVVDEYGGMAGLVTLEDVLEAIVGDLPSADEQPAEPEIAQLADNEFEVSGRLSVHYWSQLFGAPRLAEGVATIGGLVTARLGRPARVGDAVRLGNVELEALRVQRRRVDRVRVRLLGPPEGDAGLDSLTRTPS
jgi:CBS domain containing-hemolysin-like protein